MRHAITHASAVAALLVGCAPASNRTAASSSDVQAAAESRVRPAAPARDTLWLLARTAANDAVHSTDTEADLIQRYGADNVRRETIALGEGESEPGTTLFASDPLRRVEIMWGDTIEFRRPDRVEIRGRASRWVVAPGVSLGTTLAALERLNGRPFLLFGFGWDYSGTVNSWDGGRLDSLWSRAAGAQELVGLRVGATMNAGDATSIAVDGGKLFKSSHPGMAARQPEVYDLWVHPR